jgi:hypothetical protein
MATETAPIAAVADPLRLVLFGMPAAGKSSLLGALSQAARLQEHLLNGRLTDLTHGLEELRTRLYEEQARRTADEVVPYPVDYEPFADDGPALVAHRHCGAVVFDCDGRVANDLLVRHKALDEESPEGTLAREVLEADVLILVVDAAAPAAQIDADFTEFDRFLRLLEQQRGEQTEVAGLPVFLVLTKCDLLAEPGATAGLGRGGGVSGSGSAVGAATGVDGRGRVGRHRGDAGARCRTRGSQPRRAGRRAGGAGGGSSFRGQRRCGSTAERVRC